MSQGEDWYFLFVFAIGILGLLVGNILFWANKKETFSARLLAGFIFAISIMSINFGLMASTFFLHFPHLWRCVGFVAFCGPVFSFLYVKSLLFPFKKIKPKYFFLFFPSLVYTLILIPLYLQPASQKLIIIKQLLADKTLISLEPDVLLPNGWGVMARVLFGLIMTICQFVLIFKWKKINSNNPDNPTYKWAYLFSKVLSLLYVLLIIEFFFHLSRFVDLTQQIIFTLSGIILFISLNLLFRPHLLYGMNANFQDSNGGFYLKKDKKGGKLTNEQKIVFKEKMEQYFIQDIPFVKHGYSINELSSEINIPVYLLSAFINEEYHKNFNELINDFRIKYIANLLNDNPNFSNFTIESLSQKAGFSSRSSLNNAIKKSSGQTPADFFRLKNQTN
jgi:AraC-like DNA-binding protein